MLPADVITDALLSAGVTHIVWIPDSHLGRWDDSISKHFGSRLIRPTREGEAIGIAAGLMLGNAWPLVIIQCTGLFEAGDAIRNVVHDLKMPLKIIVGIRSWQQRTTTADNCPAFTEPFVNVWQLPFSIVDPATMSAEQATAMIQSLMKSPTAGVLLWGE